MPFLKIVQCCNVHGINEMLYRIIHSHCIRYIWIYTVLCARTVWDWEMMVNECINDMLNVKCEWDRTGKGIFERKGVAYFRSTTKPCLIHRNISAQMNDVRSTRTREVSCQTNGESENVYWQWAAFHEPLARTAVTRSVAIECRAHEHYELLYYYKYRFLTRVNQVMEKWGRNILIATVNLFLE